MPLVLQVKTEWSSHSLELKPGESIVLGRSPEVNIQIPRPSVSQEHLRITWDGTELLFQDLGSSNGTYRMPQDSPFVEARFPPRHQALTLKLSKSLVDFSWQVVEATSTMALDPTRTEVAPSDATIKLDEPLAPLPAPQAMAALPVKSERAEIAKRERAQPARIDRVASGHSNPGAVAKKIKELVTEPSLPEIKDEGPGLETKIKQVLDTPKVVSAEAAIESSAWILTAIATGAGFLFSYIAGRAVLKGIASAHGAQLRNGGMLDVLIIWGGFLVNRPLLALGVFGVGCLALLLFIKWLRAGKGSLSKRLATKLLAVGWAPIWPPRVLAIGFFFLLFFWPLTWAAIYQTPASRVVDAMRFWRVLNHPAATSGERIQQLRTLLPRLQGSSLLYKEMYLVQRQRILEECKGVGTEAPWDDKKVCLVLLTAVAIESLEEVQPGLLGDVAARAAILLSLDGVSRVVAVEGLEAPTIPFFLNSLDAVGLGTERQNIEELIYKPGADAQQVLESLLELRKRIELRLEARQIELALPRIFSMRFPSPIESGI